MALLGTGEGRIIIVACREGQVSYIGKGDISIFTQALVNGLRGNGVRNSNGFISAFGLYEHIYESVTSVVKAQIDDVQEPELTVLKGVGPFAVSLYQGASTLGGIQPFEALPPGLAVRQISPEQSVRMYEARVVHTGGGAYTEGNVYTGGGPFIGRDQINIFLSEKSRVWAGVPRMPNHFVGRETQIAELVRKLCSGGSYALSAEGLPGVGKTTLAVALAHHQDVLARFADGVLWAGLGPHAAASSALLDWADALDVDLTDIAEDKDRSKELKKAIGDRALLLIIDDAWEREPAELLRCGGPNCVHLLTTRNQRIALKFAGHVESVEELAPQAAREFLHVLAPKAYDAGPELADRLLEAVGYLPLAIELLGGYLNAGESLYYAAKSRQALDELTDPARRLALAGQRIGSDDVMTLEEIIALSLDGLREESASAVDVFYQLGAFAPKPARFSLAAAEAVTQGDAAIFALLADRNLLEIAQDESHTLHQTLWDVARTRTADEGYQRHRDYYLALVNEDREAWQRIETVYSQVQQAWRRTLDEPETPRLLDFVWALRVYQERRGLWQDFLGWANRGLKWTRDNDERSDEATLLTNIGAVYDALGDKQQALDFYNQALPLRRAGGRPQRRSHHPQQHRRCLRRPGRQAAGPRLLQPGPAPDAPWATAAARPPPSTTSAVSTTPWATSSRPSTTTTRPCP